MSTLHAILAWWDSLDQLWRNVMELTPVGLGFALFVYAVGEGERSFNEVENNLESYELKLSVIMGREVKLRYWANGRDSCIGDGYWETHVDGKRMTWHSSGLIALIKERKVNQQDIDDYVVRTAQ